MTLKCILFVLICELLITKLGVFGLQLIPKIPGDDEDDAGQYESKRENVLDCTCGHSETTTGNAFPWHVLISHHSVNPLREEPSPNNTFYGYCSGTIINSRVVLTSNACLLTDPMAEMLGDSAIGILFLKEYILRPEDLRVWMLTGGGDGENGLEVEDLKYDERFLYEAGVHRKVNHDVAMLTLKTPLDFKSTSPVCLPTGRLKDELLEGLTVSFSEVSYSNSSSSSGSKVTVEQFSSNIYPRMRCRLNAGIKGISDKFLCTETPPFSTKHYNGAGAALLTSTAQGYIQLGIVSWSTYHPLLNFKKAVTLSTGLGSTSILRKIDEYSKKMDGKWCKSDSSTGVLPTSRWADGKSGKDINDEISFSMETFKGVTSRYRTYRRDCVCGKTNSFDDETNGRIQGGEDAPPYKYGWMVQLLKKNHSGDLTPQDDYFTCGATIINSRLILTAAHCLLNVETQDAVKPEHVEPRVRRHFGTSEEDEGSITLKVKEVFLHLETSIKMITNDIGMISLQDPIDFPFEDEISSICLPITGESLRMEGTTNGQIIGWGLKDAFDQDSEADILQMLKVKVFTRTECLQILEEYKNSSNPDNYQYFKETMDAGKKFCVVGLNSVLGNYSGSLPGDSGGPLFFPMESDSSSYIQGGVASANTLGGQTPEIWETLRSITFYTKVQDNLDFIDFYSLIVDATWCIR